MAIIKPSNLKGTRDHGPKDMIKRNFIFDTIKSVFKNFGFQQIETPSMERLEVLTGKYGEEGDQLIFKVLNSGEKVKKADIQSLTDGNLAKFANSISEKAMRYDLTVPFARFVVMNNGEIPMPFKRYQIQPVWRADRPNKGRYQEFFQCDADVVGTESLLCEAEIILMIKQVFSTLNISDYTIKVNNRKVLTGLAEYLKVEDKQKELFVAIDKLDKLPFEKVAEELENKGFTEESIQKLNSFLFDSNSLDSVKELFNSVETGKNGASEIEEVFDTVENYGNNLEHVEFDVKLARGLSYYTGCIFEVKVNNVSIGSVSGGGRYDDLTSVFGLKNIPGVGISFGVDRIYDVMNELQLFPESTEESTKVLITNFDKECFTKALPLLNQLRQAGIKTEIFPDAAKMKKQFNYADKKEIPFVLIAGSNEFENKLFSLKNMTSGEQEEISIEAIIEKLS